MEDLKYSNEFLKNLEPIITKNDFVLLLKIKKTLENIAKEEEKTITLNNTKTHSNSEIFLTTIDDNEPKIDIVWTKEKEQKKIITMIKNKV